MQRASVSGHYDDVVAALKRNYDWSRIVFRHHLKRLEALEQVPDTYSGIKNFRDEFETHVQVLKAIDGWMAGQIITGLKTPLLMEPRRTN